MPEKKVSEAVRGYMSRFGKVILTCVKPVRHKVKEVSVK